MSTERTPPHNFEAEQQLLGAILVNNRAFEKVSEFLKQDHFADTLHGRIFDIAGQLIERGQIADHITLKDYFERDEDLAEKGGSKYIRTLASPMASIINASRYGKLIYDLHLRRELIACGEDMVNAAFEGDAENPASALIEEAEGRLYELAEQSPGADAARNMDAIVKDAMEQIERARDNEGGILGLPTGLIDIDRTLGGLQPSDLIILGARPGMGKTSLAMSIALNVAEAGTPVGVFSLEMKDVQLSHRLKSSMSGVDGTKIARGQMTDGEWESVKDAGRRLAGLPLVIDHTPGLSIEQMRARVRRMKRKQGIKVLIIDHLGLVKARGENRTQEITKISGMLKVIARELDIPVLTLCQLSRGVESRDDKRPNLADLRDSGSIEQDADIVAFIYREHYYLEKEEPQKGPKEKAETFTGRLADWHVRCAAAENKAEVIIAKNRHGATRTIPLFFRPELTQFGNLYRGEEGQQ